ncbi:branched-chain amino acid ABC transporter permease [Sulfitobacter sp. D35]|uniref:branched-chain amino acid ABC transporter permease n=1 Tax=Sulfitobacter sp. D35 TaxID=3083252 RepID=UPI00296FCF43|nr:branched-chain amino acid ABC transporter permease [Sulfitobacter sp. D35]MDW4499989.1 branched-chain amino acid ABC transporter permease [Sulfitobacter sp. D35]
MEYLAYAAFFLTIALSYAIICLGLNVQWGQTGLFNVGVAGFVGLGAYTSAILTSPASDQLLGGFGLPIALGWVAAVIAGMLLACAVALLTLRMRADYLAITTFGIAVALQLVFQNAEALTGGVFGLSFIPRPFAGLRGNSLAFNLAYLALTAAVVLGIYLLLQHLTRSPWGRVLRGIREDEVAAQALGKNPVTLRLQAFALGGGIMALAGAVQAHFIGFIAPANYLPMVTFQVWAMLIVGGSGNNAGAILGAVLVWAIWALSGGVIAEVFPPDQQARAASLQIVLIGVMLCLILLWRPQGLLPEPGSVSRHLGRQSQATAMPPKDASHET